MGVVMKEYSVDIGSENESWLSEKDIRLEASKILYEFEGRNVSWLDIPIDSAISIVNDGGRIFVTTKTRMI